MFNPKYELRPTVAAWLTESAAPSSPAPTRSRESEVADALRLSDTEIAAAERIAADRKGDKDFFHALGGWGALLDIGLPWIAFLVVYASQRPRL